MTVSLPNCFRTDDRSTGTESTSRLVPNDPKFDVPGQVDTKIMATLRTRGFLHESVIAGLTIFGLSGCAELLRTRVQQTEEMLAEAGFQMKAVDSAEKQAHLVTLTQLRLVRHRDGMATRYVYADSRFCDCLFAGDESAYQRYQKMLVEKDLVDQQLDTIEANVHGEMNWGMWGPWWGW